MNNNQPDLGELARSKPFQEAMGAHAERNVRQLQAQLGTPNAPGDQMEQLRRRMEEANQSQKRTEARMLELLHVLNEAADVIAQDQQALVGAGFENGMWVDAGLKERWEYLEGLLGRLARALGHEAR